MYICSHKWCMSVETVMSIYVSQGSHGKDLLINYQSMGSWLRKTLVLLHRSDLTFSPLNLKENLLEHQDWIERNSTCMWHGGTLTSAWWRKRWICISWLSAFVLIIESSTSTRSIQTSGNRTGAISYNGESWSLEKSVVLSPGYQGMLAIVSIFMYVIFTQQVCV